MKSLMVYGAHRTIIPKLLEWCDEASVCAVLPQSLVRMCYTCNIRAQKFWPRLDHT
jgi:hypothetical protein